MCGRYALTSDAELIAEVFEADTEDLSGSLEPRYNIAPTQTAPVVVGARGGRRAGFLRWGLVPHWAGDPGEGARMINARSETVAEKPAFRDSFHSRRCLVPADGFYEWDARPGGKQPFWIYPEDRPLLALAGIWARWTRPDGGKLHTYAILTRGAPPELAWLHDRVPLVLAPETWEDWLARGTDPEVLRTIIDRAPHPRLASYAVSPKVNHAGYDEADCLDEVDDDPSPDPQTSLF
ncbi:MAG: SOS response-associated peptidase [Gemmatimonadetes bacterium]|nr:SOS response-associated peptidase [Gemmatimonadota bacterium]